LSFSVFLRALRASVVKQILRFSVASSKGVDARVKPGHDDKKSETEAL
jgi:hypothetical protein